MAKSGTKWPEDVTLRFVEWYAQSECLWNLSSPLYRTRSSRQAAYQRLGQEFGLAPTEVKFKIKNLRSTYHQELKRNNLKEGTSTLKWYHIMDDIMMLIGRKTKSTSDTGNSEKEIDVVGCSSAADSNVTQSFQSSTEDSGGIKEATNGQQKGNAESIQAVQAVTPQNLSVQPIRNDASTGQEEANTVQQTVAVSTELERSRSSERIAQQAKRRAEDATEELPSSKRINTRNPEPPSSADSPSSSVEVSGEASAAESREGVKRSPRATKAKKDGKTRAKPGIAVRSLPRQQPESSPTATPTCVDLVVSEQSHGVESGSYDPYLYSNHSSIVPTVTVMGIKREQPAWARNIVQVEQADAEAVAASPPIRTRALPTQQHPQHFHNYYHEENEFEVFGRSVALQMQRMSTVTALRTKLKIQTILTEERIRELLDA